jgi:hypothetical protein
MLVGLYKRNIRQHLKFQVLTREEWRALTIIVPGNRYCRSDSIVVPVPVVFGEDDVRILTN